MQQALVDLEVAQQAVFLQAESLVHLVVVALSARTEEARANIETVRQRNKFFMVLFKYSVASFVTDYLKIQMEQHEEHRPPLSLQIRHELAALRASAAAMTDTVSGLVAPGFGFDDTVEEMPASADSLTAIVRARDALDAITAELAPLSH